MKIAVVDDEEIWRRKATKVIKEYLQEEATIRTYSSGDALLEENEEYVKQIEYNKETIPS